MKRSRAGVTVLEVLFSIGVVVIGLLGVIALLPLAAQQARKGLTADQMSIVGTQAAQAFRLRGMARQDRWVRWYGPPTNGFGPYLAGSPGIEAVCIDPRFVETHGGASDATFNATVFPYYQRPNPPPPAELLPRMTRVTLSSAGNITGRMTPAQIDQIFVSEDDLVFDLPRDRTLLPRQRFGWAPGPDGGWGIAGTDDDNNGTVDDSSEAGTSGSDDIATRRQSDGRYSWFATLVPKLDSAMAQSYVLSIVVVQGRDNTMSMNAVNERLVEVPQIYGGYGGGDVRLTASSAEALDLRSGDWLMMAAPTTTGQTAYRWYRVLATAGDPLRWDQGQDGQWGESGTDDDRNGITDDIREAGWPTSGSDDQLNNNPVAGGPFAYTLEVTLHGEDWERPEWHKLAPYQGGMIRYPTQATIVTGTVGVFQRTIRLESPSIYSN